MGSDSTEISACSTSARASSGASRLIAND